MIAGGGVIGWTGCEPDTIAGGLPGGGRFGVLGGSGMTIGWLGKKPPGGVGQTEGGGPPGAIG
jgi:hypothetical protein